MKTVIGKTVCHVVLGAALLGAAGTAFAGAHTWDVNEVFSNADGTIQFVELVEANGTPNELGVPSQTIASNAESFTIGGAALSSPSTNKFFLIATSAFAALSGAPTPDAIMPGGSVPFFATGGDTVSYGPYDSFAFGAVPTDGINSMRQDSTTGLNSPTNYAGTTAAVDASPAPAAPGLNVWGMALLTAILVLAGTVVVRRSRATAA